MNVKAALLCFTGPPDKMILPRFFALLPRKEDGIVDLPWGDVEGETQKPWRKAP